MNYFIRSNGSIHSTNHSFYHEYKKRQKKRKAYFDKSENDSYCKKCEQKSCIGFLNE